MDVLRGSPDITEAVSIMERGREEGNGEGVGASRPSNNTTVHPRKNDHTATGQTNTQTSQERWRSKVYRKTQRFSQTERL